MTHSKEKDKLTGIILEKDMMSDLLNKDFKTTF